MIHDLLILLFERHRPGARRRALDPALLTLAWLAVGLAALVFVMMMEGNR